jgi:hypothetical protein
MAAAQIADCGFFAAILTNHGGRNGGKLYSSIPAQPIIVATHFLMARETGARSGSAAVFADLIIKESCSPQSAIALVLGVGAGYSEPAIRPTPRATGIDGLLGTRVDRGHLHLKHLRVI